VAAKFENGILQLSIPKKEHKQLPQNSTIQIQ
jgi:HSP20 family molecular chaperone IbpA